MTKKQKLIKELKQLNVVEKKPVVLTSGKRSNYYCDIKKSFGSPKILNFVTDLLIENPFFNKATCVAAFGYGGISLATAVSLKSGKSLTLVREIKKKYGTEKQIEGYFPSPEDKVILVDDVLTTGKSLMFARDVLEDQTGTEVLGGIVIVKREDPNISIKVDSLLTIDDLK